MNAILDFLNHYWPVVTIIATLLPSPIAKFKAWIVKILPKSWSAALLNTTEEDIKAVIAHLAEPGGSHTTAVAFLVSITSKSSHPLTTATADWVVTEIELIYKSVIKKAKAG